MRMKLVALLAGSAIALTAAIPAAATPWDDNGFDFGLGTSWELDTDFTIDDVDLGTTALGFVQPYSDGIYTDIWDGGLEMELESTTAGIDSAYDCTDTASDIDIALEDDDVVITCLENWADLTTPDLEVSGEIRIYGSDGDLVRYTLEIHNASTSDITDFQVRSNTDWGSDGEIWAYQNFDAGVLAVPAPEANSNAEDLQSVDSNWVVNFSDEDAPGSLAWGNDGGLVNVDLVETDGDYFGTESDTFTVAAGETVYVVYFTGWDPASLIELGYEGDGDGEYVNDGDEDLASTAVAENAVEFDSFSGRLIAGLPAGANVINWGPIPEDEVLEPEAEDLAATGADTSSLWAGLGLLIAGVAVVAVRRRSRA